MNTITADTIQQLLARTQSEPAFLQSLLKDTSGTLAQQGIAFPAWLKLRAIENGQPLFALNLPPRQPLSELSDDSLEQVAGGFPHQNDLLIEPAGKNMGDWNGLSRNDQGNY